MKRSCQRQTAVLVFPGLPHDLVRADAGRRQQNVSSSPHMFLGTIAVRNDRFEPTTIGGRRVDNDSRAHPTDSHASEPAGIPYRTLSSDFVH